MLLLLTGLIFLILKVMEIDPVAAWSWWVVLSPFAATMLWWWWADASGRNKRIEIEKMEKRKKDRRAASLESLGLDTQGRRKTPPR